MANNVTTPPGRAQYPYLTRPDTKFEEDGVYRTQLIFEGQAATKMATLLDRLYDEAYEEAVEAYMSKKDVVRKVAEKKIDRGPDPYEEELDEEGEETGRIIVKFKNRASGERQDGTRWTWRPAIFDARGEPVEPGLKIGSGSLLKVSFEPSKYYVASIGAGVSNRLQAVQVLDLETWGPSSAEDFGFDSVDNGFSVEDADETLFEDTSEENALADDDEDADEDADPFSNF